MMTLGSAYSAFGEPPGQWFRFCKTDASTCVAKIALLPRTSTPDQLIIVQVDTSKPTIFISGDRSGRSAHVQIDSSPAAATSACDGATCAIMPPEAERVLRQMQSGRTMRVEFVDENGRRSGPFETTLQGFPPP
jgi:invasion protein IalB